MALIARAGGSSELAPHGLHLAVCSKITDEGDMPSQFGTKPKVRITWQLEERSPTTGRRYEVSCLYTLSIHSKSRLGQHLESWLGHAFTDAERADGFDLESMIGKPCQVNIVHAPGKQGGVFANVSTVIAAPKSFSMAVEQPEFDDERDDRPF